MATTLDRTPAMTSDEVASGGSEVASVAGGSRAVVQKVLVGCGLLYSVSYALIPDIAGATGYAGYSPMSQAVSELSATGAPTRAFLTAMIPVWSIIMLAFGVGVWLSAGGSRALRVTGGLLLAQGVVGTLWLFFPMTSRQEMISGITPANDVGHIALTVVTVVLILSQIGFGAAAFGMWFRIYSAITAATVLLFGSLTGMEAPKVPKGDPTPWMGLFERINIWAWLVWIAVLAIMVLRTLSTSAEKR